MDETKRDGHAAISELESVQATASIDAVARRESSTGTLSPNDAELAKPGSEEEGHAQHRAMQIFFVSLAVLALSQIAAQDQGRVAVPEDEESRDERRGGRGDEAPETLRRLELQAALLEYSPDAFWSKLVAAEALEHGVVDAERLGGAGLRKRLELAALRALEPEGFERLRRAVGDPDRLERWLGQRSSEIEELFAEHGIALRKVEFRVKDVASIWRKMNAKGIGLSEIHDILGLRLVVDDVDAVYSALALLQSRFTSAGPVKDYVAQPKPNGYRSVHAVLAAADGQRFEVQLRTTEMHRWAEAQHWAYKAGMLGAAV